MNELFFKQFKMLSNKVEELLSWVASKIFKLNIRAGITSLMKRDSFVS